jgi:uncharacterized membrane protein (DUF2068 family)
MPQQTPEAPDTKRTQLFFPVMSTLIFIGLAIYELPGSFGWIYLVIAIFGIVTVYLSWKANKRRAQSRENDLEEAEPDNRKEEENR